jgi:carbonic anhydrase/acetyltransferase-like protein (isoleucine patch superfamily)
MKSNVISDAEADIDALVRAAGEALPAYVHATPRIDASAFIASNAVVVGDVTIGAETSIWFGCVLRGDVQAIRIGARCNIQDATVIHASTNGEPTRIGDDVTVGHAAVLHACTLESGAFVGLGALVLDRAIVRSEGMLAAGAVLTSGKVVGTGELWAGNPARLLRELRPEERAAMRVNVRRYVALGKHYQARDALAGAGPAP